MHVHVDPDRCQGHSRCYDLAPELFDVDDLGNGFARGDGTVPAGLEDKAQLAASNCPEGAVVVTTAAPGEAALEIGEAGR